MLSAAFITASAAEDVPDILSGNRAVQPYGGAAFYDGEKTELIYPAKITENSFLISEPDAEKLFGIGISRSGNSISISNAELRVGSDIMTVDGEEIKLSAEPVLDNGVLYLPAVDIGENLYSGSFADDGHGLIIAGTDTDDYEALKEANLYLFFDRDSGAELKSRFMEGSENGEKHPRLIADAADFERLKTEVKTDTLKRQWYSRVIYQANSLLSEPVLEYKITEGRLLDVSNSARSRLEYLGFAYNITGDTRYSDRGIAELMSICSFPDWHQEHFLDTGTLASAAAIGYDWLYSAMDEDERRFIAQRAQALAFEPAAAAYEGRADFNDFWVDTETNWSIVCNGGIVNLALATGEHNTDTAMEIMSCALRSLESAWYRIAPDGAWYEGPSYWSYMLTHMSRFMSAYDSVMDEEFGKEFMGLDKYGRFQIYLTGPDGLPNNFHDADETLLQNDGQFYLADLYNDVDLAEHRAAFMAEHGVASSVMDIIWCEAGTAGGYSGGLPADMYFRETEFVSMRGGWGGDDSWVSFHGGSSDAAHDHIDPGTFVFCLGGVRWAIDLGREPMSYLTDSNNPAIQAGYNSYYFYRRKGEGHNIVVIDPDSGLETDQHAFAEVTKTVSGDGCSYSVIDLSAPYADDVYSYQRGYKLSDDKRALTVRDEIDLRGSSELHWYMHTRGNVRVLDNNTAMIEQDGKKLLMRFTADAGSAELSTADAVLLPSSPQFSNTPNDGVTKLDYTIRSEGKVNITVKMFLMDESFETANVDTSFISEWSVSEPDCSEYYKLANANEFSDRSYELVKESAFGGRADDDIAYSAVLSGADAGRTAEAGFEIPYYPYNVNGTGKKRTLELSVRYNDSVPYTTLKSYIATALSDWGNSKVVEFVRFENGSIYVNGTDTGLTARDGEWFRIVVEEHYEAKSTRVIINGTEYDPGLDGYIFGNRWTQLSAGVDNGSAKVTVSDIVCYEGGYISDGSDKPGYRVYNSALVFDDSAGTLTINGSATDVSLKEDIITDGTVRVAGSLRENSFVSGAVHSGDILVISSENGSSYAYYTIAVNAVDGPDELEIKLFTDSEEFTELKPGVISAEFDPDESMNGKELILIIAVYNNGELSELKTDRKTVNENTLLRAETPLIDTKGINIRAMVWDTEMVPYAVSIYK